MDDRPMVVQKAGFLAAEEGVELSIFFQKKTGAGFFGGEGFIMQKLSGRGKAFVAVSYTHLEENQMIQVQRPTQPEPWRDLDDLIFQGDGWLASDR